MNSTDHLTAGFGWILWPTEHPEATTPGQGSPPESVLFTPSVSGFNADMQFIFVWR